MSGHTPGPWHVQRWGSSVPGYDVAEGICSDAWTGRCAHDEVPEEDRALMAAALELLEACRGMLAVLDGTRGRRWEGEFADRCRAAIAKATGGAP